MLKQLLEKLEKARADLRKVYDEAGSEMDFSLVKSVSGTTAEKIGAVRKMNDEMEALGKQIDDLRAIESSKAKSESEEKAAIEKARIAMPGSKAAEDAGRKAVADSLGRAFTKAGAHLKENHHRKEFLLEDFELKTLMERSAGWPTESLRSGRLVDYAVRPIQVLDLIPKLRTSYAAFKYIEETTRDESLIVEKAEGAAYGEGQFALTERSATIEKLPAYLPVTDEQLEDVEGVESYIDNRLREALLRRADYQALNGTGVTPLMLGITQKSGTQSVSPAADDGIADVIARAIKDVMVTGRAIASGIIMHPTDWLEERLRKTKDGAYIWGNPSDAGPSTMWGLPVAQADSLTAGGAVVGDFRMHSAFVERRGIVVKVGYVNDDLAKGRQAVVASLRGAFVWDRAAAFAEVDLPDA